MFTHHFKMTLHPFTERAPVDGILKDERLTEGLARLEYLASDGQIALITGPTGAGKSSLLKLFLKSLSPNRFRPLYLHLTSIDCNGILKLIIMELGEQPKRGKERLFLQILDKTKKSEHATIIVLDEAHLIPPETLTDLRLLVSSIDEGAPTLKIVLSGQDSLLRELKRDHHAALVHRITVRYHIPALKREQTSAYIDFHMRRAGASEKVFEAEAKGLIHDYSSGLPRQINNIATTCLINAASRKESRITEQIVNETMTELRLP